MTSKQQPSEFPEQPSTLEPQDFNYARLKTEMRIFVQQYTLEIKTLMRRNASGIFDIEQKLIEVKL